MQTYMTFQNLSQFALEVELHDSDIRNIVCGKTHHSVTLYTDGIFLTDNNPCNIFSPCLAYAFPAKIVFDGAEIIRATQQETFYELLKNDSIYFEIITVLIQSNQITLEGRYYSDHNSYDIDEEAEIEIGIGGSINIEWGEICKEG